MHVRIQELEESDMFRIQEHEVRIQELEEADIGEAAMKIQLLVDYIISVETKTVPIANKPLERLEKYLGLTTEPQRVSYRTLTDTHSGPGEERKMRSEVLKKIKREFNLSRGVERYIAKACHGRDAEIPVAWTEEDYSLLELYINKEKKAFPAKFIPDLGSILKGLFAEAQSRVAMGPWVMENDHFQAFCLC